ncbi:hypothetical protein [Parerythrobacter jejuensis]|uniref:Uncharacterized protein n=1 Tax=Parerythrobacter jejuensis TaxID=795812 RepID=A0A845ARI7_9SPHN|nr:hypothetical protein [Parerythrobacter jejuensis]MXP31451.1 hypothetical protein [Parerythrobacter jejuensis]
MRSRTCGKCGGRMAAGALVTPTQGGFQPAGWLAGALEKGWFGIPKVNKKDLREVLTYRCDRCGVLENYAE